MGSRKRKACGGKEQKQSKRRQIPSVSRQTRAQARALRSLLDPAPPTVVTGMSGTPPAVQPSQPAGATSTGSPPATTATAPTTATHTGTSTGGNMPRVAGHVGPRPAAQGQHQAEPITLTAPPGGNATMSEHQQPILLLHCGGTRTSAATMSGPSTTGAAPMIFPHTYNNGTYRNTACMSMQPGLHWTPAPSTGGVASATYIQQTPPCTGMTGTPAGHHSTWIPVTDPVGMAAPTSAQQAPSHTGTPVSHFSNPGAIITQPQGQPSTAVSPPVPLGEYSGVAPTATQLIGTSQQIVPSVPSVGLASQILNVNPSPLIGGGGPLTSVCDPLGNSVLVAAPWSQQASTGGRGPYGGTAKHFPNSFHGSFKQTSHPIGFCYPFNHAGCSWPKCKYLHKCSSCQATGHGAASCKGATTKSKASGQ